MASADRSSADQRQQEIAVGLRWPDGRRLDYDADDYFKRNQLALTLPPQLRKGDAS